MDDNKYCKVYACRFSESHVTRGHCCGKCQKYGHGSFECNKTDYRKDLIKYFNDELPNEIKCKFGGCKYYKYHTTEAHHCENCMGRLHSKETCPETLDKPIKVKCPICKQDNIINKNQQKIYGVSDICSVCMENKVSVFFPNCGHVCVCNQCVNIISKDVINEYFKPYGEEYLNEMKLDINSIKIKLKDYPSYLNIYNGMGTYTCVRRLDSNSKLECIFISTDDIYDDTKIKFNTSFIQGYAHVLSNIIKEL